MSNQNKSQSSRMRMLATAAKLSSVLAVMGVSNSILLNEANASEEKGEIKPLEMKKEDKVDEAGLKKLLNHAIESGDMKAAIEKYGKEAKLNDKHKELLRSFTKDELKDVEQIRDYLNGEKEIPFRTRRG
ncbi:hypothetical protein [Pleionea litopenaei]|uniref:Uncharacterized protein n=1 Tax=Pleionea litopenaei TaxID=3070815 RepID=A0AA51RSB9_9GAMM|nr:hypothetical protein [Pleionea sp. HL-JVS1]WMS86609.1 hypothetical protein Q9312_15415 [Pleionea sp. HL-JVS1]